MSTDGDPGHLNQVSGSSGNGDQYAHGDWPAFVTPAIIHTQAEGKPGVLDTPDAYENLWVVDREVGGKPGLVDTNPYTIGVVDTPHMEKFALRGSQARIRRPRESSSGPVGVSDAGSRLAVALANASGASISDAQLALAFARGY